MRRLPCFGWIVFSSILVSCATEKRNEKMVQETVPWNPNYEESLIPPYTLPEVLKCSDGSIVRTSAEWNGKRRPELLKLFRDVMYGAVPPMPDRVRYEVLSEKKNALGGLASRREIRIHFEMKNGRSHAADILLYIPAEAKGKVPVFVGLTFGGNHVVTLEPDVLMTGLNGKRDESFLSERGAHVRRWPLEMILRRGYALAVASYHDFFPDYEDGWETGIYTLFFEKEELKNRPKNYSAIGAWAWGFSRMLDCLETVPEIDTEKAAVIGHSRLGKSSLWAGAQDERFKLVCVNDSGCGGAALSRRLYGETLFSMYYKHSVGKWWFTDTLVTKVSDVGSLPLDQHELIALVAPRSVAVHSATEDQWADPKGEYLSACHAGGVYKLFGKQPLAEAPPPQPATPAGTDVSYYLRSGKHDLLQEDWQHYLDMADRSFAKSDGH